jgi:hypothetical protein
MKQRYSLALFCIAPLLMIFCSCQKNLETKNEDRELRGTPLPGQQTYCRIESIWESPGVPLLEKFWLIAYDEFENPTFMNNPNRRLFKIFRYDDWHRLREFLGDYGNGYYEYWHFYGYDGNGRIGVDTMYIFGEMGTRPTDPTRSRIAHYEYDNLGRVTRAYGNDVNSGDFSASYQYDASGNLVRPGVTYDDKVSIYRTNDIWMFLMRDYSKNNPAVANEYNAAGYPTFVNNTSAPFAIMDADLRFSRINYSCRQTYW